MPDQNNSETNTVSVIRVFLASPSDLAEERRIARAAVDEINKTVARPAGFHVDLIGWEDTLSSARRPQAIINDEMETCQMFIGMLWARWGTPPDIDGHFTSGFEEEFKLASDRHAKSGEPHVTLFFKDVEQSKLSDAGPELSKVVAFRDRIIAEKKVLFETFADANGFGQKVRLSIAGFIHELDRARRAVRFETSSSEPSPTTLSSIGSGPSEKPPSDNRDIEAAFLAKTSRSVGERNSEALSAIDVARLRNIAAAHGRDGNDELTLGAHDANLIYKGRNDLDLSPREISALTYAGIEAWPDENKPLWSWLADCLRVFPAWLDYSTVVGPARRRVGVFRTMTAMRTPLAEDDIIKITELGELWFGASATDSVKNAALDYIGEVGRGSLVALAEVEFERNNYATRKAALEAVVCARGRDSVKNAARFAVEASFDVLGDASMTLVLSGMGELDDAALHTALEHRTASIRARAIEILSARKKLTDVQMRRFFGDVSIEARRAAVAAYVANVRSLSDEEAKEALILKEIRNGLGSGNANYDLDGHAALDEHKRRRLAQRPLAELEDGANTDVLNGHDYYFAIAKAYFPRAAQQLRYDVDDRFKMVWAKYLDALGEKYGRDGNSIAEMFDKNRAFRCRSFLREALDILVARSEAIDLPRLRRALDEDAADPRLADIDYLRRWGNWEDIPRIAKIASDYRSVGGLATLLTSRVDTHRAAVAILKLAGDRIAEIPSLDISPAILTKIISSMAMARFRKLGRSLIEELLSREADAVRKVTALQVLCAFGTREAKAYLSRYLDPTKHRYYYNVMFWLDLCEAWDRDMYRAIAQRELERMG
jgi:hypothetical protein